MTLWRDLKIGAKILSALGVLLFAAAAVGGVSFLQMKEIHARARDVRESGSPALADLRVAFARLMRAQSDVLVAATTRHGQAEALFALDSAVNAVEQAHDAYKILAGNGEGEAATQFARIWPDMRRWQGRMRALVETGDAGGALAIARDDIASLRAKLEDVLGGAVALDRSRARDAASALEAAYQSATFTLAAALMLGAALGVLGALALLGGVARPLGRATAALQAVAQGNLQVESADDGRNDEIGALMRVSAAFKAHMLQARRLEADAAGAKARAGEERRVQAMRMAGAFNRSVNAIVAEVARASQEFERAARVMNASAADAALKARAVEGVSENAANMIASVALAAEQLSRSVQEIGGQVGHSRAIAGAVAAQAGKTDARMRELAALAETIDGLVQTMSDIAGQADRIACDAVGEPAPASERNSRVLGEIVGGIGDMRATALCAIETASAIVRTMEDADRVAERIAAAVRRQAEVTAALAGDAQEASKGAQAVTQNIGGALAAAQNASATSLQMLVSARQLAQHSDRLHWELDAFLTTVRASRDQDVA